MSLLNWLLLIGGSMGLLVGVLLYCLNSANKKAEERNYE